MLIIMGGILSFNLVSPVEVKALDSNEGKTVIAEEEFSAPKAKASFTNNKIEESVKNINAGQGTLRDFRILKIRAKSNIVERFNKAVLLTKEKMGRDLTKK